MANIFKTTDSGGLIETLRAFALAIRQFFGTKTEMDVVATALTDLDNRKIEASDIPASLPANGGNADYAESAGNAGTLGGYHESAFSKNGHTHTISEITNFPTIGNGRLILKNGNDIIDDNFTANKGDDTIIDLNSTFTNKIDFNLLGDKVDRIDTSIAELNTALQVENPFNEPEDGDEDSIETVDNPYENAERLGSITLNFWNIATYRNFPVYNVFVLPFATVKEPLGTISYYCGIFLLVGITGSSIAGDVGFTLGNIKNFFIRGKNLNNDVCGFDVRGDGNTNTANACIAGGYLYLRCSLKLHGGDSGTGNDIMQKAAAGEFDAYLCLRQTP